MSSLFFTSDEKYDPGPVKGGVGESDARALEKYLEDISDTSKCVWIPLMKRRRGH